MNYFEFVMPYYALIKAKNAEEAVEKYLEVVGGEENEFEDLLEESKLVPEYYASAKFAQSKGENGKMMKLEEVLEVLESKNPEVLLVDGSLI